MKNGFGRKLWFWGLVLSALLSSLASLYPDSLTSIPKSAFGKPTIGWVQPNVYRFGDSVDLLVNKVISQMAQAPYPYHDLPFICPPTNQKKPIHDFLSNLVHGDSKAQSDYVLKFGYDDSCKVLCARKTGKAGIIKAKKMIEQEYSVQWLIDEVLPASSTFVSTITRNKKYVPGFPLGYIDQETGKTYINNHVMLVVRYNAIDDDRFSIVGLEVYPKSVSDYHCPGAARGYQHYELNVPEDKDELTYIPFTYSVYWREDFEIDWTSRWKIFSPDSEDLSGMDGYQEEPTFLILLKPKRLIFIVLILSVLCIYITRKFDKISNDKEIKKIIFNTISERIQNGNSPNRAIGIDYLTICVSMGVEAIYIAIATTALTSSLYKVHNLRNIVVTNAMTWLLLSAIVSSFTGTWLRMYIGQKTKVAYDPKFTIVCGSALPGLVLISSLVLNIIVLLIESNHVLPFQNIFFLTMIYFIVSIPLSLVGGFIAIRVYKKYRTIFASRANLNLENDEKIKTKFNKNQPRNKTTLLIHFAVSTLIPFFAIKTELTNFFNSTWLENTSLFNLYGYVLTKFVIVGLIVSASSMLGCCILLFQASKNRGRNSGSIGNWRWTCFQMSFSVSALMELYSIYYIFQVLRYRTFSNCFLAISYGLIFNIICGLSMGSIGYLTCCWFIVKISRSTQVNH